MMRWVNQSPVATPWSTVISVFVNEHVEIRRLMAAGDVSKTEGRDDSRPLRLQWKCELSTVESSCYLDCSRYLRNSPSVESIRIVSLSRVLR
jgi:hypothetical protein